MSSKYWRKRALDMFGGGLSGTFVGLTGETFDGGELVEDFIDITVVEDAEPAKVGHAVAQFARKFDDAGEVGKSAAFRSVSVSEISRNELVRFKHDVGTDGFAGEGVGKMLKTVVDQVGGFDNGVVENRHGRARHDDGGDALGFVGDAVAKLGDLLVGINLGEGEIVEVGARKFGVGENLDLGKLIDKMVERMDGNDANLRWGIMVGVEFDRKTPAEAGGDVCGEEKHRVAGHFDEASGRIIEK